MRYSAQPSRKRVTAVIALPLQERAIQRLADAEFHIVPVFTIGLRQTVQQVSMPVTGMVANAFRRLSVAGI